LTDEVTWDKGICDLHHIVRTVRRALFLTLFSKPLPPNKRHDMNAGARPWRALPMSECGKLGMLCEKYVCIRF